MYSITNNRNIWLVVFFIPVTNLLSTSPPLVTAHGLDAIVHHLQRQARHGNMIQVPCVVRLWDREEKQVESGHQVTSEGICDLDFADQAQVNPRG
jgi:hypothetical protein